MDARQVKAERFGELHRAGDILVLPNAWDAASARVFELAGARAIATTSGGLAAVHGYADGEHIPRDELIAAVRSIVRTVSIPVSVDLETGFGETPHEVCEIVAAVLDAGAVGINIEDGKLSPNALVSKIAALRDLATRWQVPLFINARTDVYLRAIGEPSERFDEAVRRLHHYEDAGADGVFVPGVVDSATIGRLAQAVHRPLNILATAATPAVGELQRLGVKRVSIGAGALRATLSLARRIASELLGAGSYSFLDDALPSTEVNAMFRPPFGS